MSALALLDLAGGRRAPVVRQSEAAECGLACVAMVAAFHGHAIDLSTLRRKFPVSLKGATLKTLMQVSEQLGFTARALRGELEDLDDVALPVVLHWNLSHFVVLTRVRRTAKGARYTLNDPAAGELTLSREEVSRAWTGVALELQPGVAFERRSEVAKVRLFQLWSRITGLKRIIVQSVALSIVLQLVALATPFYMQTAIDTALPASDHDLLTVLALGFGGLVLVQLTTQWLRSLVLLNFGTTLGYQLVVNLYRHMMRLPLTWFERRHVGDVVSRFGSTQPIVQLLSQGLVAAALDGAMALLTLALMFVYSAKLAGIAVVALALYVALRLGFFQSLRAMNVSQITANAAEQSTFIESVRGIAGVKVAAQEANRQRLWQNRKATAVNAQIRVGRMQAGSDATQTAVLGLEQVLFVYLAIKMAMSAEMSVGMVFAYQAYKQQFLGAGMRLLQAGMDWRMADIKIELRQVSFRYGVGEPEVLKGVNLVIEPGEKVAIVGPSGGGKTTLLKIMLGLLDPTEGEVLIDGVPLAQYGKQAFRHQVGAVLQDDLLYAGSVAENIAEFDPEIDMDRVRSAAARAAIADEIGRMPMSYETLVGDMGSSLSGGQRQRVIVARALYREPRILFADEATASLDAANHMQVSQTLLETDVTTVLVTHRAFAAPTVRPIRVAGGGVREEPIICGSALQKG